MKTAIFALLLFPLAAMGQEGSIPKPVIQGIARDLADLQATVIQAQSTLAAAQGASPGFLEAVKVTGANPTFRLGASSNAAALPVKAFAGQEFKVIDRTDNWYAVRLTKPVGENFVGWVSAADVVPSIVNVQQSSNAVAQETFRLLTEKATQIRDTYANNPYISVPSFTVNIGISPSVSLNFEFKK